MQGHVCMFIHKTHAPVFVFAPDVMMAARGLIQLFRNLNPQMLHKKDRVRANSTNDKRFSCSLDNQVLEHCQLK